MTARRLSQCIALSLAGLTWWVMVSRPGAVGSEFVVEIHAALAVLVAVFFGLSFVSLRFATTGSTIYWTPNGTDQIRQIVWLALATLGTMLAAEVVLTRLGWSGPTAAKITYLLAGTLIPAAFLQFGLIAWPDRSSYPERLRLLLISGLAIGLAAAWSYAGWSAAPDEAVFPSVPELIVIMGAVLVGATFEEIVFRVLLLTSLVDRTGSRFQAVFLSGVAFGLMHVPGAVLEPLLHGDWAFFQQAAFEYAPLFLLQTFLGLLLGVLWLRTGSITLIALTHATLNMGKALGEGLLPYG